jgi:hypothetical protein
MSGSNKERLLEIADSIMSCADNIAQLRSMLGDVVDDLSDDDGPERFNNPLTRMTDASLFLIGAALIVRDSARKIEGTGQ